MSEQPEVVKLKRITIKTESGSRWFDDPHKLQAWCQEQRSLYSFYRNYNGSHNVQDIFNKFDQSWSYLRQAVTDSLLPYIQQPDRYESQAINWQNTFQQFLIDRSLFTQDAHFVEFLKRQQTLGDAEALGAFCAIWQSRFQNFDAATLKGYLAGLSYLDGKEGRAQDEDLSCQSIKERWDREFTEQRDSLLLEYRHQLAEGAKHNDDAAALVEHWHQQTEQQTQNLAEHIDQFKQSLDQTLQTARADLENLKKTYDEDLALRASVRYWGLQQKDHRAKSIGFGIALGVVAALVMIAIIAFSFTFLELPKFNKTID